MGGRYYLTGTQLGAIKAFLEIGKIEEAQKFLKEIEENQFLGEVKQGEILKVKLR